MVQIHIDGTTHQILEGKNVLEACLALGYDLPYFCWHPAMGSVGACRQCAVKQFEDEDDRKGQLVMACMTPAKDDTRISIADGQADEMRKSVIEFLMANHPHDCPVCDEGGECHLQDMTVMAGHTYRRHRFKKRSYHNQYLGPFINHEMNRCIQCYRCVRFYRDYAGGRDLDVFGVNGRTYFGRESDGVLENVFRGNLVEVCPTGVFTDKTQKAHYTRKWDLQTAPSVCHHCSAGCNIVPGERYGTLRRIRNRYNDEVNGYFICDRGRFGYEFVNTESRVRQPLYHEWKDNSRTSFDEIASSGTTAMHDLAGLIERPETLVGIGSPRASLESNFALMQTVGEDRFFLGVSEAEYELLSQVRDILDKAPARPASLRDIDQCDAVLVLGEDLTQTAARMALSVRQAARNQPLEDIEQRGIPQWDDKAVREAMQDRRGPVYLATVDQTELDDIATDTLHAAPADIARLGFAVASELAGDAPPVDGLCDEARELARRIADDLAEADRPLVVSGTGCGSPSVLQAASNVARALGEHDTSPRLSLVVPECNSLGLSLMGGRPLSEAFETARHEQADTLLVLENDLYRRAPARQVTRLVASVSDVVVLDHTRHQTTDKADLVLSAGTFAESSGTLVNNEGRAQRFYRVVTPDGPIGESWRWLAGAMVEAERAEKADWDHLDAVIDRLAEARPALAGIREASRRARFRIDGQKIPRQLPRYSGRTAMHADWSVHEPAPPQDPDSALSYSMEGTREQPPADLVSFQWAPGWNSEQALNKFQDEIPGPIKGGPSGKRLFEAADEAVAYFERIPDAFEPREQMLLAVPLYHIFGSEALSARAPAVAERAPPPYAAMHPDDMSRLSVAEGDELELSLQGTSVALPVQAHTSLARGTVGVPVGLRGLEHMAALDWPTWTEAIRGSDE